MYKEDIKAYQTQRFLNTGLCAEAFCILQDKFRGIDISGIRTVDDLQKRLLLPKDLQLHSKDFICVEREKIIDYLTTSGTLGAPVTFVETE